MKRCWMIVGNVLLFILFTMIVFYFVDKADRALFHRRPESVAGEITIPSPEHIKWTLAVVFVLCIKPWWITVGKLLLFVVSTVAVVSLAAVIDWELFDRNYVALPALWIFCGVFVLRMGFGLDDIMWFVVVPIVAIGRVENLYTSTMLWILGSGVILWGLGTRNRHHEAESSTVVKKHFRKEEAPSREGKASPTRRAHPGKPASERQRRTKPRPAAPKISRLDKSPPSTRFTPFSWFYLKLGPMLIAVPQFVAWVMRYCVCCPLYISVGTLIGYYFPLFFGVFVVVMFVVFPICFPLTLIILFNMLVDPFGNMFSRWLGIGWGWVMHLALVCWPEFFFGLTLGWQVLVGVASFLLGHIGVLAEVYGGPLDIEHRLLIPSFTEPDQKAMAKVFAKTGKYRLIHKIRRPYALQSLENKLAINLVLAGGPSPRTAPMAKVYHDTSRQD